MKKAIILGFVVLFCLVGAFASNITTSDTFTNESLKSVIQFEDNGVLYSYNVNSSIDLYKSTGKYTGIFTIEGKNADNIQCTAGISSCSNTYDGNWGTGSNVAGTGIAEFIYFNFTISAKQYQNITITHKWTHQIPLSSIISTIFDDNISENYIINNLLQLRVKLHRASGASYLSDGMQLQAYNGTNWILIREISNFGYHSSMGFYELEIKYYNEHDFQNPAIDTIGGNDGTLSGYTFNDGTVSGGVTIEDGAMVFDGVNDYVVVASANSYQLSNDYTYSLWINRGTATGLSERLISIRNTVTTGVHSTIYIESNGRLAANHRNETTDNFLSPSNIIPSGWNLVTFTSGNDLLTIYLNGVNIGSMTRTANLIGLTGSFHIGRLATGTQYYRGSIDQTLIFDRALTTTEITEIYNAGKDAYSPISDGLVAQYSGKDYIGTPSAPTTILDMNHIVDNERGGSAMRFDGVNDYVTIDSLKTTYPKDAISVCSWAKSSRNAKSEGIFSIYGATGFRPILFYKYIGNNIRAVLNDESGSTLVMVTNSNSFNLNSWNFACFTYTSGSAHIFLNGDLSSTYTTLTGSLKNVTTIPVNIGNSGNGGQPFNGSIDTVLVYNRVLTQSEMLDLYNNPDTSTAGIENLVASYGLQAPIYNKLIQADNIVPEIRAYKNNHFTRTFLNTNVGSGLLVKLINTQYQSNQTGFNITDGFNNSVITNANISFTASDYSSVDYAVSKTGFFTSAGTKLVSVPFIAQIYEIGDINITIRNANTGNLVTDNVSMTIEGAGVQRQYSTTTGNVMIDSLLLSNSYQVRLQSSAYDTSFQTITYNSFTPNITYYLTTNGTAVSVRVQDVESKRLSNANVIIKSYVGGILTNTQSKFSDVNGLASFILNPSLTHLISVTKEDYQSLENLLVDFTDTNIIVILDSDASQIVSTAFDGVTWQLSPFNFALNPSQLHNFTFTINASDANLNQFSVSLYNGTTLVQFQASQVASGGTLTLANVNVSAYTNLKLIGAFTADGFAQQKVQKVYIVTSTQNYDGSLLELRQRLQNELTEFQRLIIFALTFIVIMIVLAVYITGFVNVLISLSLAVLVAWIIGMNMFFLVAISAILMLVLFAQTLER